MNQRPIATRASGLWHAHVYERVIGLLRQGITPDKAALGLAFGIGLGIFPVLGVATVMCTLAAMVFGLNLPAIQLANYLVAPVQLLLIVPFVRVGEFLVRASPQPVSVSAGLKLVHEGVWHAIVVMRDAIMHAALAWLLLGPVLIFTLYRLFIPILERILRNLGDARPPGSNA